jgi:CheY-like chemotaxis protein
MTLPLLIKSHAVDGPTRPVRTILIVDDEVDIANCLEMLLSYEGYATRIAHNGREALDSLKEMPLPDLIMSDVMMPVLDGYALVKALKADLEYRDIPIVMSSAARLDRSQLQKGDLGSFFPKPYNIERLLSTIRNLIAGGGGDELESA